jgi:hypothetical protein
VLIASAESGEGGGLRGKENEARGLQYVLKKADMAAS